MTTILIRIDAETGQAYDRHGKPCGRWVPDETTLEMEAAGDGAAAIHYVYGEDLYVENTPEVYRATLSAAPPPPAELAIKVDRDVVAKAIVRKRIYTLLHAKGLTATAEQIEALVESEWADNVCYADAAIAAIIGGGELQALLLPVERREG